MSESADGSDGRARRFPYCCVYELVNSTKGILFPLIKQPFRKILLHGLEYHSIHDKDQCAEKDIVILGCFCVIFSVHRHLSDSLSMQHLGLQEITQSSRGAANAIKFKS